MVTETRTIKEALADPHVVAGAVVTIYRFQTPDEQAAMRTGHDNGVGFNMLDAGFGTSLAEQVLERKTLTEKQVAAARRMIRKYVGQLEAYGGGVEAIKGRAPGFTVYVPHRRVTLPPIDRHDDLEVLE